MPEKNFVRLSEYAPAVQLDIRYFSNNNFIQTPVNGYLAPEALLTKAAADALLKVQQQLQAFGLGLKIFDAYRPQQAVNHFLTWTLQPDNIDNAQRFYPQVPKTELFLQGYLAERSSHSRGSTVDLSLIDLATGIELDMGTEFDFFGPESAVTFNGLSSTQRANRLLLKSIMEQQGFYGFDLEWWHFTLANEPYPNQYFDFPIC